MNDQLIGKIFIEATLELKSPLSLGSGEDIYSDSDLMRDPDGHPMIPATSFVGALQSYINQYVDVKENENVEKVLHYLFPKYFQTRKAYNSKEAQKSKPQSHLIVDDLFLLHSNDDYNTTVRDGVRIDHGSNTADGQGKYDYEILEHGPGFQFNAEIIIRESIDIDSVKDTIQLLHKILSGGDYIPPLQIGALTSHGFGQLKLKENSWKVFDFTEENQENYFRYLQSPESSKSGLASSADFSGQPTFFKIQPGTLCTIEMTLRPTTPFKIGGGTPQTGADDASLRSNGDYIISAISMKGAIRHHAYRIANTVHESPQMLINTLFGTVEDNQTNKSRFWTSDTEICNPAEVKEQTRVAIDRFTGGAMESALFQTEPVWPKDETEVKVKWKVLNPRRSFDPKKVQDSHGNAEIGLLLLVARDLMTEFLPIGGEKAIGRGRFQGKSATIRIQPNEKDSKVFTLKQEDGNLKLADGHGDEVLNAYVKDFLNWKPNNTEIHG